MEVRFQIQLRPFETEQLRKITSGSHKDFYRSKAWTKDCLKDKTSSLKSVWKTIFQFSLFYFSLFLNLIY